MLDEILARTRADVARRRLQRPAEHLVVPDTHPKSLLAAMSAGHTGLVMECKHVSPSSGVLRADYDPAALAHAYAGVADAVSVLVDGPFFGGSLEHLRLVRAAVDLPVLAKGFVVEPYQVREARAHGADAVLLIVAALEPARLAECLRTARTLGMDTLVEVHDEAELAVALELGARLIGINARNLRTLEVDLAVTARLARLIPPGGPLVVAESGIRDHRDLKSLRPLVDAFLVGTSLVRRADTAHAARELAFGRLKVCGLTRPEDAAAAWRTGATWGGLVLAVSSRRHVTLGRAAEVRQAAPLRFAGVFVDEEPARVASAAGALGLDAVQLHGREDPGTVATLRRLLPSGCALWKAAPGVVPLATRASTGADRVLLDGLRAGSGRSFDWADLEGYPETSEAVIAGGLTAGTAATADRLGAWALDVSSGVEEAPGLKSASLMTAFCAALRGRGRV